MLIIDRYIIKKGLPPFFYCITALVTLILVINLFENLDTILKNNIPIPIILRYYIFLAPSVIIEASPIAILIGSIFALHNLSRFHEITAIKANGIHMFRIILPFLFWGLILSFTNIIINETILPKSMFHRNVLTEKYFRNHNGTQRKYIKKNIALKTDTNAYLIKEYNIENKEMSNITILQYNDKEQVIRRVNAEKGQWTGAGWMFYNGIIYHYNKINKSVVEKFSEKFIQIPEKPIIFEKNMDITMMNMKALKNHIQTLKTKNYSTVKEEVILHSRLAVPFANLIVLFIGIPFILNSQHTSLMKNVIFSLVITFLYKTTMIIGLSLGNGGTLPPILAAWLSNIMFASIGIGMITTVRN